ncbi:MAG: hypothetical protein HYU64_08335 [Armatimonadetes bacterium]|nr:hypothetical protein [Armatimonadota bacterium]
MSKEARNLVLLALLICAGYAFFGQLVPQKRLDPPTPPAIRQGITEEEMVEVGREIVHGPRGNCMVCHGFGESLGKRGPDLALVGRSLWWDGMRPVGFQGNPRSSI